MDDLVAELTLRLRNEMNAGLEEIKGEFGGLDGTLQSLRDVLGGLTAELAAMRGPLLVTDDLAGVVTAADEAVTAVDAIGAALKADADEAKALKDAMAGIPGAGPYGFQNTFAPPQAGDEGDPNRPAFVPPGTVLPVDGQPGQPEEENEDSGSKKKPAEHGNEIIDAITGFFALAAGWEGEKSYAEFQSTAMQAAIIEGYSGKAALDEAKKIMHESYNQAYLSRGNVDEIEQAYLYLVKQQLPPSVAGAIMGPLTEGATTYDAPVDELTNTVYHLYDQLKIPAAQMSQAVSILGAATHLGLFSLSDFAEGLPSVGTQFAKLGFTGLSSESVAAAALESVRAGTPDASHAYTDLTDLLNYMTSGVAVRFFDRTKRSQDLLGEPIMDLLDKYHIKPLDLPKYFNDERDKGVDPLDAMVDYMHDIGANKMSPTDEAFLFNSLFHNQEAGTAMLALEQNYDKFQHDKLFLGGIGPGFLDDKFQTAIQGDSGGVSQYDTLLTYLDRLYGQNTFGWFVGPNGSPSQADADHAYPGSSAFNIPITLNVNVDKSGNVTANAHPSTDPWTPPAGTNVRINQGQVLNTP